MVRVISSRDLLSVKPHGLEDVSTAKYQNRILLYLHHLQITVLFKLDIVLSQ